MEERLYKKLESYGRSDFYPFHMPGHKRNPLAVDGDFPVERDITEINGFDNLHHAGGSPEKGPGGCCQALWCAGEFLQY